MSSNSALNKVGPQMTSNTKRSGIIRDSESRIRGEDELGEINDHINNESINASDQNILNSRGDESPNDFGDGFRYKP